MPVTRSKILQFRVTELELQQIQTAADVACLRPSDWVRQLALATAVTLSSHQDTEELQISLTSTGQVKYVSASVE